MRWVTAVRWLLHQWLNRGRGQCEARGRRRDKTALAFQPEAPAPLAPVDVSAELRQSYNAWRSAGRDKIVNSGVGPKTSMPVHSCANSASCVRIAASENLYRSAANGSCPCTCPTRGAPTASAQ